MKPTSLSIPLCFYPAFFRVVVSRHNDHIAHFQARCFHVCVCVWLVGRGLSLATTFLIIVSNIAHILCNEHWLWAHWSQLSLSFCMQLHWRLTVDTGASIDMQIMQVFNFNNSNDGRYFSRAVHTTRGSILFETHVNQNVNQTDLLLILNRK